MNIRKATDRDIDGIVQLIQFHAEMGQMLFRTREDVAAHIRDFLVAEINGEMAGACGLSFGPGTLVEVRSLAVHPDHFRQGIGTALVNECLKQATLAECDRIFVLTYARPLFAKLGFRVISMSELPDKIWKDCQGCLKKLHCDETAMIRNLIQVAKPENGQTPLMENNEPFAPVS